MVPNRLYRLPKVCFLREPDLATRNQRRTAPTPLQERPVLPSLGLRPFAHQSNKMGPRASGSHSHGKKRASSPEKSSSAALIDLTSPEARPPKKVKMEMPDQNAADAAQRRVDKAVNDRWGVSSPLLLAGSHC